MSRARADRMAREMMLAGASGRRGWMSEAEAARKRRALAQLVRDVAWAALAMGVMAWLFWAAAHGLDSDAELWAVGDYGAPEEVKP